MGPSWQPDPRGKSSESCNSALGHLHENFSSQGFHSAKCALWKQCLKQAQHSLLTSTTCLAHSQHQKPSLLLLEFGSEMKIPASGQVNTLWAILWVWPEFSVQMMCFLGEEAKPDSSTQSAAWLEVKLKQPVCAQRHEKFGIAQEMLSLAVTTNFKSNHLYMEGRAWNFSYKHTK